MPKMYNISMNRSQFIFLESETSKHDDIAAKDAEKFLEDINYQNIRFDKDVFFIISGGTEEIFKSIYKKYKEPYFLLATNANNSLPAALEIASFLTQKNLNYRLIHGDNIKDQFENESIITPFKYELKSKIPYIYGKRLGVIGKPSDWLISSNIDYNKAKEAFGVTIIDISFDEFYSLIKYDDNVNIGTFSEYLNEKINENELKKALSIYSALKRLVKKYNLDGLTVRCFELLNLVHSTSCLALAMLNSEGIICSCEGDIPSLLTMMVIKYGFHKLSFQCNPSYVNFKGNYLYLAHCTIPLKMCEEYAFDTHFESGIGVGIRGKLKTKPQVCILKIDPSLDKFVFYSGHIISNLKESNLCRTQIKVRLYEPVNDILTSPCGNHLVVFYDENKDKIIKKLAK